MSFPSSKTFFPPLTQKEGVRGGPVSAFFQPAAAIVVGIGLLALPFLIQANDEEKTNKSPEVSCLWVQNHGSIGFDVEFDVTAPSDSELFKFYLKQDGSIVDEEYAPSATLESEAPNQGWLEIPGYDGGPPLPYPGYLHSFEFKITGEKFFDFRIWGGVGGIIIGTEKVSEVNISLYVVLNSEGALYSMHAWASDSDGDGYEVPVYYSAGGDSFITLP